MKAWVGALALLAHCIDPGLAVQNTGMSRSPATSDTEYQRGTSETQLKNECRNHLD